MFLSSYSNTHESLGELEKAVAYIATAFLLHPNFHSGFYNSIETQYMFSISFKYYAELELSFCIIIYNVACTKRIR